MSSAELPVSNQWFRVEVQWRVDGAPLIRLQICWCTWLHLPPSIDDCDDELCTLSGMDRSDRNAGVEIRVAIHLWNFFSLVLTIVASYAHKSLLEWEYNIQQREGKMHVLQSTCYDNLYWDLWQPLHIFLNCVKVRFYSNAVADEGNHGQTAIHLLYDNLYIFLNRLVLKLDLNQMHKAEGGNHRQTAILLQWQLV